MQLTEYKCYKCNKNAKNDVVKEGKTQTGIIYVRALEKGEWGSFPICKGCWKQENGEAVPRYVFVEEKK